MKVSVIIPIYNAERYIERCVRSLCEQTLIKDIEYFFINDCSTDNSLSVLKKVITDYPIRKDQIRIINNKNNLGPSEARKIAINTANGDYIAFCDADDWVEPDMYEKMYKATNCGSIDVVACNYWIEDKESSACFYFIASSTPQEALQKMHDRHFFPYAMWNIIVRRDLLLCHINSVVSTNIREDTYLNIYIFYYAKGICFISDILYHYCNHFGSLVHSVDYSHEAWLLQKQNIDNITTLLYSEKDGYLKYHYALNNFIYMRKQEYRNAFDNLKVFYREYRWTHGDFIDCDSSKYSSAYIKFKLELIYNTNYLFYWMYNKIYKR